MSIPTYQAGHHFNLTRMPRDLKQAKEFVLAEISKLFEMAEECGAQEIINLSVCREISMDDIFGDVIAISMRVRGENMQTTVRPVGQVALQP